MSEKTYCVALTVGEIRVIREALAYVADNWWTNIESRKASLAVSDQLYNRLVRISVEKRFPPPAPPLPLLSDVHVAAGIKFGGDVQ